MQYTIAELNEILKQHKEWIEDNAKGKKANLYWADLSEAKTDKRYISISCIGSRKGMTTYCFDEDKIWCGCFTGTMAEFKKAVIDKYGKEKGIHYKEYMGWIKYVKSLKGGK